MSEKALYIQNLSWHQYTFWYKTYCIHSFLLLSFMYRNWISLRAYFPYPISATAPWSIETHYLLYFIRTNVIFDEYLWNLDGLRSLKKRSCAPPSLNYDRHKSLFVCEYLKISRTRGGYYGCKTFWKFPRFLLYLLSLADVYFEHWK